MPYCGRKLLELICIVDPAWRKQQQLILTQRYHLPLTQEAGERGAGGRGKRFWIPLLKGFQAPPFMDGEQQKCISCTTCLEILRPYFLRIHSWMGFLPCSRTPAPCLLLTQVFALWLGIFLLCTSPTYAQQQVQSSCPQKFLASKCVKSISQIFTKLAQANVVYLGETHDSLEDHQNQLKIIQELYQTNPKIAIALEMFQRPYQGVVNQYLAGKLTEKELVNKSEYEKRWGFPWENYAPILRFAKEKKLPVLALNTPSEITHKVAREGLESLTASERQFIPPFSEIRTDNQEYRQRLLAVFQQHQAASQGSGTDFERFFLAQVLWDETMAEGVANFVKAHPDYQVVVLAGQGHIIYDYGIPSRVARRLKGKLIQRSVLLSPPHEETTLKDRAIADFILFKN